MQSSINSGGQRYVLPLGQLWCSGTPPGPPSWWGPVSWPSLQQSLSLVVMPLHESRGLWYLPETRKPGQPSRCGLHLCIGDTQAPRGLGKVQVLGARPLRELEPLLDYAPQFGVKPSAPNGPGKMTWEMNVSLGKMNQRKTLSFCHSARRLLNMAEVSLRRSSFTESKS